MLAGPLPAGADTVNVRDGGSAASTVHRLSGSRQGPALHGGDAVTLTYPLSRTKDTAKTAQVVPHVSSAQGVLITAGKALTPACMQPDPKGSTGQGIGFESGCPQSPEHALVVS